MEVRGRTGREAPLLCFHSNVLLLCLRCLLSGCLWFPRCCVLTLQMSEVGEGRVHRCLWFILSYQLVLAECQKILVEFQSDCGVVRSDDIIWDRCGKPGENFFLLQSVFFSALPPATLGKKALPISHTLSAKFALASWQYRRNLQLNTSFFFFFFY